MSRLKSATSFFSRPFSLRAAERGGIQLPICEPRNDEELRTRLVAAAREKPKWGYRRLQLKLVDQGMHVNHKRVYRVYREAGLLIRRRRRKRLLRAGFVRPAVTGAN